MSDAPRIGWRTRGRFVAGLGLLVLAATACGGGSNDSGTVTGSPTTTAAAGVTTTATGSTPTTAGGSTGALAGTWSGEFTQTKPTSDSGTFGLTFEGSAPSYTGTITISGTCEPSCPITATVTGNTIAFGSISPFAITYDGTISGSSMSGSYTVGTGPYEGTWKATKAS